MVQSSIFPSFDEGNNATTTKTTNKCSIMSSHTRTTTTTVSATVVRIIIVVATSIIVTTDSIAHPQNVFVHALAEAHYHHHHRQHEASTTSDFCPPCTSAQCIDAPCPPTDPYMCIPTNGKTPGCLPAPFTPSNCANGAQCCDVTTCGAQNCNEPCEHGSLACEECSAAAPYVCIAGSAAKNGPACGNAPAQWLHNEQVCTKCCDWKRGCVKPCLPCGPEACNISTQFCPLGPDNLFCIKGKAAGGCFVSPPYPNSTFSTCSECCTLSTCENRRKPSNLWDIVPPSENCTRTPSGANPAMGPDPRATRIGGMDVSHLGCKAWVSDSCCGYTPRFNWILSTCESDPKKRHSMACLHKGANTSTTALRYIAAYQFDVSHNMWRKDQSSSFEAGLFELNLTKLSVGGGKRPDWDLKYAPTTNVTGTNGLGPPAMMFVLSARRFSWSAFYILNQITLNRGPGGEKMSDNCWSSSSGEFDLVEPPFWALVELPLDRLYMTLTADSGRCIPAQKNIPKAFGSMCTNPNCCEMCSCPNGTVCGGDAEYIGFTPSGCFPINETNFQPNTTIYRVKGSNVSCGHHFGAVAGGSGSSAYFETRDPAGDSDTIYAAVVDRDGVFVYRWPASDPSVWPGLGMYTAQENLTQIRPSHPHLEFKAPCLANDTYCAIHEPSCPGECPLLSAAHDFGLDELSGSYAAEAARDHLNWWDHFISTGQGKQRITPEQLPRVEHVKFAPPPPLPFYCNRSCNVSQCHYAGRCPNSLPYMCTKGDAIHGCASGADFWPYSPHCSQCCDIRTCFFKCTDECSHEECEKEGCLEYMCSSGPNKRGCNSNATFWGTRSTCYSCCDCYPHHRRRQHGRHSSLRGEGGGAGKGTTLGKTEIAINDAPADDEGEKKKRLRRQTRHHEEDGDGGAAKGDSSSSVAWLKQAIVKVFGL